DYGKDEEHEWPRAWYGVKGYFRWLESKAYKMHVRVLLSRYRAYRTCPDCQGRRFQPEALLYKVRNAELAMRNAECGMRNDSEANEPVNSALRTPHSALDVTLADFYRFSVFKALLLVDALIAKQGKRRSNDPLALVLSEVRSRLAYLEEVGLGYLTLD